MIRLEITTQPCWPAWLTMLFSLGALFSRMLALPLRRVVRSVTVKVLLLLLLLSPENLVDC